MGNVQESSIKTRSSRLLTQDSRNFTNLYGDVSPQKQSFDDSLAGLARRRFIDGPCPKVTLVLD